MTKTDGMRDAIWWLLSNTICPASRWTESNCLRAGLPRRRRRLSYRELALGMDWPGLQPLRAPLPGLSNEKKSRCPGVQGDTNGFVNVQLDPPEAWGLVCWFASDAVLVFAS